MRVGRIRFTLRRASVGVAVISLLLAYAARYRACNAIAEQHRSAFLSGPRFNRHTMAEHERVSYYSDNIDRYTRAAIHPWVGVPIRFVPFDPTGFSTVEPDPGMGDPSQRPDLYRRYGE